MPLSPPERIALLLQQLQSSSSRKRAAAATELKTVPITPGSLSASDPARLPELLAAIQAAIAHADEAALLLRAPNYSRLAPGLVPVGIYSIAHLAGYSFGAIIGGATVVWLVVWYLKVYFTVANDATRVAAEPAKQALALGRTIGTFH